MANEQQKATSACWGLGVGERRLTVPVPSVTTSSGESDKRESSVSGSNDGTPLASLGCKMAAVPSSLFSKKKLQSLRYDRQTSTKGHAPKRKLHASQQMLQKKKKIVNFLRKMKMKGLLNKISFTVHCGMLEWFELLHWGFLSCLGCIFIPSTNKSKGKPDLSHIPVSFVVVFP